MLISYQLENGEMQEKQEKKYFIIPGDVSSLFAKIIHFTRKTGWASGLRRGGRRGGSDD